MPSTFITREGQARKLIVVSSTTGRPVRVLMRPGSTLTGNGVALSPDGRRLYTVWIGKHSLRIERVATGTGKRTYVADGAQPAISPDGRYLAYASGRWYQSVSVRDVHTGATRTWNLRPYMGPDADLLQGHLVWLGDGRLVVMPQDRPIASVAGRSLPRHRPGSCGPLDGRHQCLITLDPAAAEPALRQQRIAAPWLLDVYSGGSAARHSIIIADLAGDRAPLERLEIRPGGVRRTRLAEVPGMALALDASGTWLLYLTGHGPTALWTGRLDGGRVVQTHRIDPHVLIMGSVIW